MLSLIGQQGPGPWPIARGRVVMATDTLTGPLCARSLSAGELGAMAKNLYGPGVRMGNWNEDVYLEEVRRVRPAQSAGGPGTPMPRLSSGPCFELPRLLCHPAHAQVPKIPPLSERPRNVAASTQTQVSRPSILSTRLPNAGPLTLEAPAPASPTV